MFKAIIVAVALLAGVVCVGTTSAMAAGQTQTTAQPLDCTSDMHWSPCP